MKHILTALLMAISLICASRAEAQTYVADPFNRDSVAVMELTAEKAVGVEAFKIAKGDTVEVFGGVEGFSGYGVAKFDGSEYAVNVHDFLIVDEDVEDPWETATARWRSPEGRTYSTLPPYLLIVALVVGALLMGWLGMRVRAVGGFAELFMPVMIALACYMEISAYAALHTGMFWWCEIGRYGFWGSVLRVIPLSMVIVAQVASYPMYCKLMSRGKDVGVGIGSLVPMGVSFLVVLPVIAIVLLVCGMFHMGKPTQAIVGTCIFAAVVGLGSLSTISLNIKSFGIVKGLWMSLFGAVYVVGAMIAVLGFVIAIWKLFVQMVITLVPYVIGFALLTAKEREEGVTADGRKITGWTDEHGIFHGNDGKTYTRKK